MEGVTHSLAMVNRIAVTRLMPVTASLALHVALVASVLLLPDWTTPREHVLFLELTEAEAPPAPAPAPARAVVARDPRPLTLPKLIKAPPPQPVPTPAPQPVEPPAPLESRPVEPPSPRAEAPAPVVPEPAAASATTSPPSVATEPPPSSSRASSPSAFATSDSAPTTAPGVSTDSRPPSAVSGQAVAALPPDGMTRRAIPRGGYQYRPSYPAAARRLGIQGTTLLSVLVADDGRVAEVLVKESAGHPDLDQAATEAVRRWRFEPARRGTEAVAMWVELPVQFRLR